MGLWLRLRRRLGRDPRTGKNPWWLGYSQCGRCGTGWGEFIGAGYGDDGEDFVGTLWFCGHSDSDPCSGCSTLCRWCWDELGTNAARLPFIERLLVGHYENGWLTEEKLAAQLAAARRAAARPEGWRRHAPIHPSGKSSFVQVKESGTAE